VFLLVAVVLAVLTVPIAGGKLVALADVRLRMVPVLFTALFVQIAIMAVFPDGHDGLLRVLHLGSYALLGVFLWANRRIFGIPVVALGGFLNFLAIAANGGVMPAGPAAARSAGFAAPDQFVNSGVQKNPRLLFLGDIWAIPEGWPFANVFSIGDVIIAIGVAIVIHAICGSRLIPARFRTCVTDPAGGEVIDAGSSGAR
jgi:hypothetical protein